MAPTVIRNLTNIIPYKITFAATIAKSIQNIAISSSSIVIFLPNQKL